jgi:hypothetical protein
VKYRLGAALAAITFTVFPGTLLAESASTTVWARDFDAKTHTVTGVTRSSDVYQLRHTAATVHAYVVDPNAPYPPGPYRGFAIAWNLAIFQNESTSTFDILLHRAAELGIVLQVERSDKVGEDGSYEIVKVAPGQ